MIKNILLPILLLVSVISFGQVPNYVPTNGLVGYWPFNGNANDESVNTNDGTVNGATLTTDRFGNASSAYDFDGVDDYISGTASSSLDVSTTQTLSMSCWINVLTFPPYNGGQMGAARIFSLSDVEGTIVGQQYALAINSEAQIYWLAHGPAGFENNGGNISSSILSNSNWEHLIMTYDGDSIKFYLNGLLVFSKQEIDSFQAASNGFLNISSLINLPITPFNGQIDDIGIWNRALNQCEISALYHAQQLTPPVVTLGSDTLSICGATTTLDAGTDPTWASYLWNTSETTQDISVSNAGLYTIAVTDTNGCIGYDTTLVSIIAPTIIASDTVICIGDSVVLTACPTGNGCMELPSNLQNGLVAHYPFCGNANDESGNGNNGTVNGATLTTDRFCNDNSAYSFDGSNYISTPSINLPSFTINVWVKVDVNGFGTNRAILSKHYSASTSNSSYILMSNTTASSIPRMYYTNTSSTPYWADGPVSLDSNWHMLTGTLDGTSLKIYIDGTLMDTDIGGISKSNTIPLLIGAYHSNSGVITPSYKGVIDEISLWNEVKSETEIQQLYQLGNYDITWSTGDTTSSITVQPTQTTTYSVTVDDGISSCTDDVTITVNDPQVNLGPDQSVCQGDSVLLDAGSGYNYYSWSTGETSQSIYASQGGNYDATVGDSVAVNNNYSLEFDGVDDYVETNNSPNWYGGNAFTWTLWVYLSDINSDQLFIKHGTANGASGDGAYFNYFAQRVIFTSPLNGGEGVMSPINVIPQNTWTHLSIVVDVNQETTLYVNGQDVSLTAYNGILTSIAPPSTSMVFGRDVLNNQQSLNGRLDDILIWNTPLAQSEIQQYMNCPPSGNETGLVGYWDFEEGSGTTTTDQTSNVNDGTLNGGVTWSPDVPNQSCVSCTATDNITITELQPTVGSETVSECNSYLWSADGQTYNQTGQYTAVLSNAQDCDSTVTLNLTINQAPTVNAGADQTICSGNPVTISGNGATSYTWDNGVSDGVAFTPLSTATYTVTGTDGNGCENTDQVVVNVNTLPAVSGGLNVSVCIGDSAVLNGSGAVSYTWDNGITEGVHFIPLFTNTYTVTGTDGNGCENSDQVDVTVNALPTVGAGVDRM